MSSRRIERYKKSKQYYKLVALDYDGDGCHEGMTYYTGRPVQDHVIVSVPPSTSAMSAQALADDLSKIFETDVIVVTHNTQFLKAERISKSRLSLETKDHEKVVEAVKSGDGCGSGVRVDGCCGDSDSACVGNCACGVD